MKQLKLPQPLLNLLAQAWGKQLRYVSYQGHTHDEALRAALGTPQGCPLAPSFFPCGSPQGFPRSNSLLQTIRLFFPPIESFRSGMVASRNLRKVFYAATTHLGMTVLARAWKRMAQLRHRGLEIEWHNRPHSALGLLRRQLKEHCWVEDSPWLWRAPHPWFRSIPVKGRTLDLRSHSRQTQEQQVHALRMQFRREAFVRYIESDRHEAEELRNTLSRPQLRRAFLEVSIPQTRAALGHGPAQRTVILAFSAAHLYRANKEGEDGSCPFCHGPQGYWHHMMWDCPENPPGVTTPGNALTRRLVWISKDPESAAALAHMSATVLRLWTIRHGNAAGRGL